MTNDYSVLDRINIAFHEPISENDYHQIVHDLDAIAWPNDEERISQVRQRGWPDTYDPCKHRENLRFAFHFCAEDNKRLGKAPRKWVGV